ncbi:hypothetical protein ABXT08_13715 [Chryseobacterium sp. NRRL B-14859]|uniref:hypothetical protein n=1 Tax=Chryseobacterium sp. NRRL B-14859 TaxID=1562763 RepID=UPI0033937C0E
MSKHKDFILTPIINILHEVVSANYAVGNGMETYPLSEHVFQSAFLRMTGSQEQKMKCICWELATEDYTYRYNKYTKSKVGECSTYGEKKDIYIDLLNAIKKYESTYSPTSTEFDKCKLQTDTLNELKALFSSSSLSVWGQSSFLDFVGYYNTVFAEDQFALDTHLFESVLRSQYELVYRHRNRCAHNTLSYQQNLPTLTELLDANYRYDNYVTRFTVLVLIDKIFIELYKKYLAVFEGY